jgi:4-diphosphocytidyl-2-C-methyl-D-erythritol kinase
MSFEPRRAQLSALAKINLGLKVLNRRPDGYHELRTVFQTVSLADTLQLEFAPARSREVLVASDVEIPGPNLVERAAALVLETIGTGGRLVIRLSKRIPMGGGLGGGSSDAAAVLLALPALAGGRIGMPRLLELAAELGSDVPFFLLGGTAVALGRGTELYPLPDHAPAGGLIVAPRLHVSTAEAYRDLARELTSEVPQNIISTFQSFVWTAGDGCPAGPESRLGGNDFEPVVFSRYPQLESWKRKLERLGAAPAMLSGSGSALYGLFGGREEVQRASSSFPGERVIPIGLVSRPRYRAMWWRRLGPHIAGKVWPPQSRYAC